MAAVHIRPMVAADVVTIDRQASQRVQLGIERLPSIEEAESLLEDGEAWTALAENGRVIACLGIRETFPGRQGVAWAILSNAIGAAHLAITRHARRRIAESPLVRIEAIVRAPVSADEVLSIYPGLSDADLLRVVVAAKGAEVSWAALAGLRPAALLRKFGAASEDHLLFERVV